MPDSATPWTVACQAPLSMARILDWNGLPFPSPRNLPKPLNTYVSLMQDFQAELIINSFSLRASSPNSVEENSHCCLGTECWISLLQCFFFFFLSLLRKHTIVSFKVLFIEEHLSISFLRYWNIVDLQCCISFSYIAKWLLYIYIYPVFFSLFSHIGHYRELSRVPCTIQ